MRRNVRIVKEQGAHRNGKARLFGYGYEAVSVLKGLPVWTVRRDAKRGRVDLGCLASVVEYVKSDKYR